MTLLGQSQLEAQRLIGPIVTPKRQTIIGCWNVRTMAETTRAAQLAKVMKEYGIEVLGISDARWKGMGSVTLQSGEKVVYVGNDEVQQGGVAIMMSAGQREPRWNGRQLAKGSSQHDSTQSTKPDGGTSMCTNK